MVLRPASRASRRGSASSVDFPRRQRSAPSYYYISFQAALALPTELLARVMQLLANDAYPLCFFGVFPVRSLPFRSSWKRTLGSFYEMTDSLETLKRINVVRHSTMRQFSRTLWNTKFTTLFEPFGSAILQDYQIRVSFGTSAAKFEARLVLASSHLIFVVNMLGDFPIFQLAYTQITELAPLDSLLKVVFTTESNRNNNAADDSGNASSVNEHEFWIHPPKHPRPDTQQLIASDIYGVVSSLRAHRDQQAVSITVRPSDLFPPQLFPNELRLSLSDWTQLLSKAQVKKVRAGDIIQTAEQPVRRISYIVHGKVSLTARSATKLFLHSGDAIGDYASLFEKRAHFNATAQSSTRLVQFKIKDLHVLFELTPALRQRFYASTLQCLYFRSLVFETSVPHYAPRLLPQRSRRPDIEEEMAENSGDTSVSFSETTEEENKPYRQQVLTEFHSNLQVHLQRLLLEGTKDELCIFALLHTYLFSSTSDFLSNVVAVGPGTAPERFLLLASATIRYHWNLKEHPSCEAGFVALLQSCANIGERSSGDTTHRVLSSVSELKAELASNETLARTRHWTSRPQTSASGLLAFIDMHTCFEEIMPPEAANILSFLDWKFFNAVPLTEFMKKDFVQKQLSPTLHNSITRFNTMTNWIVTMILTPEDRNQRAFYIQRWIKIAQCLKDSNNFSGLQMVCLALDHVYVSRLKATWEVVPTELREQLSALSELVTPRHNYTNYRRLCKKTPKFIPIVPVLTKDLFLIEDGAETFINNGSDLNFKKLANLYSLLHRISELQISLELEYKDFKVESVKRRFFEKMEGVIENEDELYELSVKREPAGGQTPSPGVTSQPGLAVPSPHKRKVFGKKSPSFKSIPVVTNQEGAPSIPLRICIKGTTPAFTELGLSLVNKTVLLNSPVQDPKEVLQLLLERLCSTMRDSQIGRIMAESKYYSLYEERERGRVVAISSADRAWSARETIVFERDRSLPKLKKSTLEILRLEYQNAMLEDRVAELTAENARLKGQQAPNATTAKPSAAATT